jgi:signal transduction histidine kinase/DNA-binding NarL/FixJ family response regulator
VAGASPTLRPSRRAGPDVRLPALAAAVAGAVDPPAIVERLAQALTPGGGRIPIRIWLTEGGGRPALLAQHPAGARYARGEAKAVVAAALDEEPVRAGSVLLVPLSCDESPFAVLSVSARCGLDPDVLMALAPIVSARLQALRDLDLDRSPSAAIRMAETAADTHAVIAAFAADAKRLLDHDRLSVYMLTPDGRSFERFAVATSPVLPGESDIAPLEDVGLTYVLQANEPFVSVDLAADDRLIGREDSVIAAAGFHGLVSVPLRVGGQPIGLLNFVSRTAGFYTDEDAAVAQQMADQVAIFVQNLRLEQHVRLAIEREAAQHERNRLAHELHDTLAQSLAEMLAELDLLAKRLGTLDADAERDVTAMHGRAQTTLDELRRSLLSLRPAELEKRSLADAMTSVLEQLEEEHGIKTSLELVGAVGALQFEVEANVFRIFQEAVANARKHAAASAVGVTLRAGEGLVLSIEDNGMGFVPSGRTDGFGLQAMRERAEEIGGRLIVSSTAGRGTSVNLSVPSLGAQEAPRPAASSPSRNGATAPRVMRVLVVDDHPLFREAVSRILEREADIRVVGQVGTAEEALGAVKRLRPDVLLLDVELPDASGIDVVRRLSALERPPHALMVSAFPESGHVVAAMKAGARGYLAKTVDSESLVNSIRAIFRGATIFDSLSGAGLWTPRQLAQLTRRELDVLRLVAEGKTNSEIADDLCLAKKTVERIVATAIAKLRARNRAHAVAKAVSLKVIDIRAD